MYYQKNQRRPQQRRYGNNNSLHDHSLCGHEHEHTLANELLCHIPSSILSIGLSFLIMFIISLLIKISGLTESSSYHSLFHLLHYVHMMFAAIGATTMLYRFAPRAPIASAIASFIIPVIFCSLSDILLPAFGASFLGHKIPLHFCFLNFDDAMALFTFLFFGVFAGFALVKGSKKALRDVSSYMHFFHVFIGILAALAYLIAYGISWMDNLPLLMSLLFFSVVIPCAFSDFIVPAWIGKLITGHNNVYDANYSSRPVRQQHGVGSGQHKHM